MTQQASPLHRHRVCLVSPARPETGIAAVQIERLSRHLATEAVQVQQISFDLEPDLRRAPSDRKLIRAGRSAALLRRILQAAAASDTLHLLTDRPADLFSVAPLLILVARLLDRRAVVSYLGENAELLLAQAGRFQKLAGRLDGLAVMSGPARRNLQDAGVDLAPALPLVDPDGASFQARESWPPLILWVGPLIEQADPATALRAFAALHEQMPEARLLIAGSGPLERDLRELARTLAIAGAVALRPSLPAKKLASIVGTASVLWCTAPAGDVSPIMLEAATRGTVIAGVDRGEVVGWLQNGVDALLTAPGNHDALARASAQVLRRAVLATGLAENARLAVEDYAWPRSRAAIAILYGLLQPEPSESPEEDAVPAEESAGTEIQSNGPPSPDMTGRAEFLWSDSDSDGMHQAHSAQVD